MQRTDQDLVANPGLVEDIYAFIDNTVAKESEYLAANLRQTLMQAGGGVFLQMEGGRRQRRSPALR